MGSVCQFSLNKDGQCMQAEKSAEVVKTESEAEDTFTRNKFKSRVEVSHDTCVKLIHIPLLSNGILMWLCE